VGRQAREVDDRQHRFEGLLVLCLSEGLGLTVPPPDLSESVDVALEDVR
jgi:hypothetical protein